jgi:hypothetical protein
VEIVSPTSQNLPSVKLILTLRDRNVGYALDGTEDGYTKKELLAPEKVNPILPGPRSRLFPSMCREGCPIFGYPSIRRVITPW